MATQRFQTVHLLSSANRTAAPNPQPTIDLQGSGAQNLTVLVNVTAVGASPSLAINVKWSMDGVTYFAAETADAFTAITGASAIAKTFTVRGLFAQVNTTPSVGGITYTLDAYTG